VKAISIRQPWAWLIIHGGKDIENRTWRTNILGRVLIHASKGMTMKEYEEVKAQLGDSVSLPPPEKLERGGIVGSVVITGCWRQSVSPWFFGPWGFSLANPEPLPFRPMRGQLGFFDAEE
jgi:hypothetical protein